MFGPGRMTCLALGMLIVDHAYAEPHIDWVDCHQNVPVAFTQAYPNISTVNLPPTLHCGRMQVPMDYTQPLGPNNSIILGLAMFRPSNPEAYCYCGTDPAASVAWEVTLNITSDFTPNFEGLLHFDLMMMDVRGTWASNNLSVDPQTLAPLVGPYPTSLKEYESYQNASVAMFQSWAEYSTPPGILEHIGMYEVVRDYELIRQALRYEKIHFLGDSTGSYRAAQYATTFPEHVGHFVLDAVVPRGYDILDEIRDDIKAINRTLLRADAFCENNATCPFHEGGRGAVPKTWREVLSMAENNILPACASAAGCNETLTPFEARAALYGLLTGQPDFPVVVDRLAAALKGNDAAFVASPQQGIDTFWGIPITCSVNSIPDRLRSWDGFQEAVRYAEKYDTHRIYQAQWYEVLLACSAWPYHVPAPGRSMIEHPMLLVTSDFDADAPTEMTTFVWSTQTPHSGLIVRHGDDHVSFSLPKQESTRIEKEFLRTGKLPYARNGTFVTVYEPGEQRAPIPDPYHVPTGFEAGDVGTS